MAGQTKATFQMFFCARFRKQLNLYSKPTSPLHSREEALFANKAEMERHRALKLKIQKALVGGDIRPWFQPKICLHTGRILGFEALVRWIDPNDGIQSPAEFLPVAVEVGMMSELDASVQRHAF